MTAIESCTSETAKYRHLTTPYCMGCGLDIGSQGDPVVPWAWQLDLPPDRFAWYNSNHLPRGPIQLRGDLSSVPVDSYSLDFIYCSHVLEDVPEEKWPAVFSEWVRCLKPGGHLILLIPDKEMWAEAIKRGQPPNCEHRREGEVGLMSRYATECGMIVIEDRLTGLFEGDYSILGVFKKPLL